MKYVLFSALLILMAACSESPDCRETALEEIAGAEAAFNQMAADSGVTHAFLHFAADDAAILRGNTIYKGRDSIAAYLASTPLTNVSLAWQPEFIDAAKCGDLGYTYGTYQFSATDTSGNPIASSGYFHTVWKRQADGKWRFIWD